MMLIEIITSVYVIVGTIFIFSVSFGLYSLPDAYCQMHATTKASTLGLISMLIASIIFFSFSPDIRQQRIVIQEVLIIFFTFITPI